MGEIMAPMNESIILRPLERELVADASENARRPHSVNTKRAYASAWAAFEFWGLAHGLSVLPADEPTLCIYLTHLGRTKAYASVCLAYAAIRVRHEDAGFLFGTLKKVQFTLRNLGVQKGIAPKQKRALEYGQLCEVVDKLPVTARARRDRAILLFGELFAGRRSEVAALLVEDLEFESAGVRVDLRRSKTDQLGEGRVVAIHRRALHCPVEAVRSWLDFAGITSGPIFRTVSSSGRVGGTAITGQTIANVIKRAAVALGLDPSEYAGHSIRRGFVTTATKHGADLDKIMKTTGHSSVKTVRRYIDDADPFARAVKV
jgi:integrase